MEEVITAVVYADVLRWCLYGLLGGFIALFADFTITKRTKWVTYIKVLFLLVLFSIAGYVGFVYGIMTVLDALLVRYKNITLAEVLDGKRRVPKRKSTIVRDNGFVFLYTVGDLKEYLKGIDNDTELNVRDGDIDGREIEDQSFINPLLNEGVLYLGHDAYTAYEENTAIYNKYFKGSR